MTLPSTRAFTGMAELQELSGRELVVTDWIVVSQDDVDRFAAVTGDRQWVHTDPEAARHGRFGSTIVHGFLLLSLLPRFLASVRVADVSACINCGVQYARFIEPVPTGSRIRARLRLGATKWVGDDLEARWQTTIERESARVPSCIAEWSVRYCRNVSPRAQKPKPAPTASSH